MSKQGHWSAPLGIAPRARKKLKSLPRTHLFEFLNENPFSKHSLGAKFELKVDQFCTIKHDPIKVKRSYESAPNDLNDDFCSPELKYAV